jgi:hypothetical protein
MRILSFLASLLVIPLALLLFIQWPLREWVQVYSRQANDMGQILFALYVAVAVTATSVARSHLAAGAASHAPQAKCSLWRTWALLACLGPWAMFMLWSGFPSLRESVFGLERFAETLTPGFFVVKLALALMLVLVLWDAIRGVVLMFNQKP